MAVSFSLPWKQGGRERSGAFPPSESAVPLEMTAVTGAACVPEVRLDVIAEQIHNTGMAALENEFGGRPENALGTEMPFTRLIMEHGNAAKTLIGEAVSLEASASERPVTPDDPHLAQLAERVEEAAWKGLQASQLGGMSLTPPVTREKIELAIDDKVSTGVNEVLSRYLTTRWGATAFLSFCNSFAKRHGIEEAGVSPQVIQAAAASVMPVTKKELVDRVLEGLPESFRGVIWDLSRAIILRDRVKALMNGVDRDILLARLIVDRAAASVMEIGSTVSVRPEKVAA